MRIVRPLTVAVLSLSLAGTAVSAKVPVTKGPITVSPGDVSKLALIENRCPTFSWGNVDHADTYELVVYRVGENGLEAEPVLTRRIPGSATVWTPPSALCLERGGQYAWAVRAQTREVVSEWSTPNLFQVAAGPSEAEFEGALATVKQYLATEQASFVAVPGPARQSARAPAEDEVYAAAQSASTQLIPETPATVSLVTEGAVGVGTSAPMADLHVVGDDSNTAGLLISTKSGFAGGVAELMFAEDPGASFGMKFVYDGDADKLGLIGRKVRGDATIDKVLLEINRDTGASFFQGVVSGDGSGLTQVNADTLDGMDSTKFSTGAHTTNTTCDGQACDGTSFTNVVAVSGDSATGFFPTGQIEEARIADAITRDAELAATVGRKTVYLTAAIYTPPNAPTACAAGWHMASIFEIPSPLELVYDAGAPGAYAAHDGTGGLPAREQGYIRTGYANRNSNNPGANCNQWTSSSASHYGTRASIEMPVNPTNKAWSTINAPCSAAGRVWCVKD